ncbi:hypothetical protein MMSR116_24845 [Methylobacterium mesophilicum SR1.6/6]|uniref:Uncharacterized protein n=1 Tax=Methylobacterium mesophilicum SR1.6/6 TaxID=908290 RepID=A0A6B9FRV7_9HYPH|nr:hypothetical protein [Methylobacterium mesophilicum]QGY04772.1 hypothetical protein MMSR116_24845 [Methylobacterium mesophilicum SR1.6/6]
MSAALPPALRRNLLLFALAFAVAATAFGTVMLTSPPTSEAADAILTDDGVIPPVTNCELLPIGDVNRCTVYR